MTYEIPTRATRKPYSQPLTSGLSAVLAVGLGDKWPGALAADNLDHLVARTARLPHVTVLCPVELAPEVRVRTRVRVLAIVDETTAGPISGMCDGAVLLPRDPLESAVLLDAIARRLFRVDPLPRSRSAELAALGAETVRLTLGPLSELTGAGMVSRRVGESASVAVEASARLGVPVIAWAGQPVTTLSLDAGDAKLDFAWSGACAIERALQIDLRMVAASLV